MASARIQLWSATKRGQIGSRRGERSDRLTEPAEMARAFEALASGGKVTLSIQDTFWGAKFGMLTDVYGVRWMFNCELKKT